MQKILSFKTNNQDEQISLYEPCLKKKINTYWGTASERLDRFDMITVMYENCKDKKKSFL